jgi:hypothetical protein
MLIQGSSRVPAAAYEDMRRSLHPACGAKLERSLGLVYDELSALRIRFKVLRIRFLAFEILFRAWNMLRRLEYDAVFEIRFSA